MKRAQVMAQLWLTGHRVPQNSSINEPQLFLNCVIKLAYVVSHEDGFVLVVVGTALLNQ